MSTRISTTTQPVLAVSRPLPLWGRLAVWLLRLPVRRPRLCVVLAVLATIGLWGGRWALLTVLLAPVVGLAGWRLGHRDSFDRHGRPRLARFHRRWLRYCGPRWRRIMRRCRLTVHDVQARFEEIPAIRRVEVTPAVDRLLIDVPVGLTPDQFRAAVGPLATAARALDCRVTEHGPGRVWIELRRRDALSYPVPALPIPAPPAVSDGLRADRAAGVDLSAVLVGVRESGLDWSIPLLGRHVLVAGRSRSGKGSVLWSTLRYLAPAIRVGLVKVTGIDPKGGMELSIGRRLFHRFEADRLEAMAGLLEREADDMDAVAASLAGQVRKFTPSVTHPLHLVVVDELATLTAYAPMEVRRRVDNALGRLLTKGAAVGWVVLGCVQEPAKDIIPMRGLFTYRIALGLDTASQVDMVLGDGMRDRGAAADRISLSTPGVAYAVSETEPDPFRVRAAFVPDHAIRDMAAEWAPVADDTSDVEDTPATADTATDDGRDEPVAAWPDPPVTDPAEFTPDDQVSVVPASLLAKLGAAASNDHHQGDDGGRPAETEAA